MTLNRSYQLIYQGVVVNVVLVKNDFWRWYATTDNGAGEQQEINFGIGSNHFFVPQFLKEITRKIDLIIATRVKEKSNDPS